MRLSFLLLSTMVFIAALLPKAAAADWAIKAAAMNCDPPTNRALIRFDIVEDSKDNHFVRGAKPDGMLYIHYGELLNMNFGDKCRLGDGRTLTLSFGEGQAFAYGMGGADPDGFFTLDVDGKKVFYKSRWYRGYGSDQPFLHSLVILDKNKLKFCDGPKEENISISDFHVMPENCSDVSERLSGVIPPDEQKQRETDIARAEYAPIVKNIDVCDYFGSVSAETKRLNGSKLEAGIMETENRVQSPNFVGVIIYKFESDIRNTGKPQNVYFIHGGGHYYDGSTLFYFTDDKTEKDFLIRIGGEKRPRADSLGIETFIKDGEKDWPSLHVISYSSLDPFVGSEYQERYTHIVPVTYKDRIYLRFTPLNQKIFPPVIIGELDKAGVVHTVCTYKERQDRW